MLRLFLQRCCMPLSPSRSRLCRVQNDAEKRNEDEYGIIEAAEKDELDVVRDHLISDKDCLEYTDKG